MGGGGTGEGVLQAGERDGTAATGPADADAERAGQENPGKGNTPRLLATALHSSPLRSERSSEKVGTIIRAVGADMPSRSLGFETSGLEKITALRDF